MLKKRFLAVLLTLLSLGFSSYTMAQNGYYIQFFEKEIGNEAVSKKLKDSLATVRYASKKLTNLHKKGYLLASFDSIIHAKDTMKCFLYVGTRFTKAKINIESEHTSFLKKKVRLTEKYLANYPFTPAEINQLKTSVHRSLENNGHPFAAVNLDSVHFDKDLLTANLVIERGPTITWSKIHIRGDERISEKLISSYIQIKQGDLYNQELLDLISSRLSLLPFIEEIKPAEILFTPWGAELFLYLKNKKVSLANGIVGLQPKNDGKGYMLTGEIELKLVNELKRAETFGLKWKSIQQQTQSLDVIINTPNLFRTRFGLDGSFNLYKRDTSYIDLKFQIGVQYALNNGSYAKFYYRHENSSILRGGKNNVAFVNVNDSKTNFYGIALTKQTLDYLPNPRKGYRIVADGAIGQRKTKDPDSTDFIKSITYKLHLDYQQFITLYKRNVLKLGITSNFLGAPSYFQNEVYRFGGQFIQRGFNEEQLYATFFTTASVEYRFLVDQNSYAFAFYDQSYYQNRTVTYFDDFPFGFGAGFTFGTRIGAFSISYALGKQKNSAISFKDGKIHFGYIAYF